MTGSSDDSSQYPPAPTVAEPSRALDLPTIISSGPRTRGRSSLLEGICEINFPIDFTHEPRLTTEIFMSPGPEFRINTCVKFANPSKGELELAIGTGIDDVRSIIKDSVSQISKIRPFWFADDILVINIIAPRLFPLKLVDLPSEASADTLIPLFLTIEMRASKILHNYLKDGNFILLAVAEAGSTYDSGEIMKIAKDVDPDGTRTLRIITANSAASPACLGQMLKEKAENRFKLGYHIVHYPLFNMSDASAANRRAGELEFFCDRPWSAIPESDRGIPSLHLKLSDLFLEYTRAQIPGVMRELQTRVNRSLEELHGLGPPRPELPNMRSFLVSLATEFQKISCDAISGHCEGDFFRHDDTDSRLRQQLERQKSAFNHIMTDYGPQTNILREHDSGFSSLPTSHADLAFLVKNPYSSEKPQQISLVRLREELNAKITGTSSSLGYRNGRLDKHVREIFTEYASRWKDLALEYATMVLCECKAFIELVFQYLLRSSWATKAHIFLNEVVDPFFEQCEELLEVKIDELSEPFEQGYGLPYEDEMFDALSQMATTMRPSKEPRFALLKKELEALVDSETDENASESSSPRASMSTETMDNGPAEVIIRTVEEMYKNLGITYAHNISSLALERCLVQRLPTMFTPELVCNMAEQQIRDLAAEKPQEQARRTRLEEIIKALDSELKYWRRFRPTKPYCKFFHKHFNFTVPREFNAAMAMSNTTQTESLPIRGAVGGEGQDEKDSGPGEGQDNDDSGPKEASVTEERPTMNKKYQVPPSNEISEDIGEGGKKKTQQLPASPEPAKEARDTCDSPPQE